MAAIRFLGFVLFSRAFSRPVYLLLLGLLAGGMGTSVATGQGNESAEKKTDSPHVPAEVVLCPALTYADTDKGPLKLDVAMPKKGDGPFPAIVIIHGSGPFAKGRKFYVPQAAEFARAGYVGVTISYRNTPDAAYPKAIEDAEAAIRWLRTNAAKYKIDPDQIAALGYSGGGAIACLLGMKDADTNVAGKPARPTSRVQAVVAYYPPSDFTELHRNARAGKMPFPQSFLISAGLEAWFAGTPAKVPERYAQASPITHVSKGMAPLLLIHGMEDAVVPFEQSQVFARKIGAKKGRVTLVALSGAGHDFDDENGANAQNAKEWARSFLAGHLSPTRLNIVAAQK